MFRTRFTKTAVSMLAAALCGVLTVVGCSDDDDNGNGGGGDPNVIGSDGNRLVGNWTSEEANSWNNERYFMSFKSNGDFCESVYQRVDDFWLGGEECYGTWNADGQYLNMVYNYDYEERVYEERVRYNFAGNNRLTVCSYDEYDGEEYCSEYTRGGSIPSGFRIGDLTLRNTEWRLESSYMEFSWFWAYLTSSSRYFDVYRDGYMWYTNGNRLYMLRPDEVSGSCRTCTESDGYEYNCDCLYTVAETVEFTYTHVPHATLRLRNTQLDIDDTWEFGGLRKRNDNNETDNRQSPFRRLQPRRALSKR